MSKRCCRTCLSDQNLHPMFLLPEYSDKYSDAVFVVTGVKVAINDNLPQQMCSKCITFINKCTKFRKKCEETQKLLQNHVSNIKIEKIDIKTEDNSTSIDITDYLEDNFKDFDDNITLDALQCNELENNDKDSYKDETDNNDTNVNDNDRLIKNDEKPLNLLLNSKKRRKSAKTVRKKETEKKENVKESIECEYCHKILTSKLSLRNHYKIHTGFDVVCEHCGKKFITQRLLLMHCRAKHGYEKTDKCSYCDYKASNAEQVKIHERLHTGEKPFICKECNAGFHRKSSYLQHIAIHLPEKTVQCEQCPARFKSKTLMRIHANRHRPSPYTFKCCICDNSFARRRNVARHLQRVHGLLPHRPDAETHIHRIRIH